MNASHATNPLLLEISEKLCYKGYNILGSWAYLIYCIMYKCQQVTFAKRQSRLHSSQSTGILDHLGISSNSQLQNGKHITQAKKKKGPFMFPNVKKSRYDISFYNE